MKKYQIWEEEHNCEGEHKNYCLIIDDKSYIAQIRNGSLIDIIIDNSEEGWLFGTQIYNCELIKDEYKNIVVRIINILKEERLL